MSAFLFSRITSPINNKLIDVTLADGSQLIGCFWDGVKDKYIHAATNGEIYVGEIVMWRENNRMSLATQLG